MQTLPGFTAWRSHYTSAAAYRGGARASPPGMVVAQLRPIGFCMADCDMSDTSPLGNAICKMNCMDDGGGGGGGGPSEPTCKPACGPCIDGTRLCIRADCETIERTCRAPRRVRGALL